MRDNELVTFDRKRALIILPFIKLYNQIIIHNNAYRGKLNRPDTETTADIRQPP